MWSWLKKNWQTISSEGLKSEVKKVLEDEEILKRRKEHLVSKFEKLMKNSEIIVEPTEEDEVDDEEA